MHACDLRDSMYGTCRGGRQRDFSKEVQGRFAAEPAAGAATLQGTAESSASGEVDAWGDPAAATGIAEPSHKRQHQPRVREQAAKRGRNRGPASRPGSAKAKSETEEIASSAVPIAVPDVSRFTEQAPATAPQGVNLGAAAASQSSSEVNISDDAAAQVVSSIAQLNLDPPVSLSPALGPVARLPNNSDNTLPDLRGVQIERPHSAKITAVSRPKSASVAHNPFSSAGSGPPQSIPTLPADLTFDSVLDKSTSLGSQPGQVTFGGLQPIQHSQPTDHLLPGHFQSALFPLAPTLPNGPAANPMWQQSTQADRQPHQNPPPNLAAAVESFYAAGNPSSSSGFGAPAAQPFSSGSSSIMSSNPPLNLPQFGSFGVGSFGSGLQFGQLGSAFGQSPFIPTGRQPDWSTGPITNSPTHPPCFGPKLAQDGRPPGLGPFEARPPGPPQGMRNSSQGLSQNGVTRPGAPSRPDGRPQVPVNFDAAAGLPDDVFDEPRQVCNKCYASISCHMIASKTAMCLTLLCCYLLV